MPSSQGPSGLPGHVRLAHGSVTFRCGMHDSCMPHARLMHHATAWTVRTR